MKKSVLLILLLTFAFTGCQVQTDKADKNQTKKVVVQDINLTKHKKILTKENLKEAGKEIKELAIETAKKLKKETEEKAEIVKKSAIKLYKKYVDKDKNTTKSQQ